MITIDTTELYANRPPKHFNNLQVINLDPLSKLTLPRPIEVQSINGDGARQLAMWYGTPALAVNDYVRCRRDSTDTNLLIVEGAGGGTAADSSSSATAASVLSLIIVNSGDVVTHEGSVIWAS